MFKKLLLMILGLFIIAVMVVVALPAKLIIDQGLLPPALQIEGVSGRWWSGQAASVTWYGEPRGQLNWQYGFPDIVTFSLDDGGNAIRSEVKLRPLLSGEQQAVFEGVRGQVQASELPVPISGVLLQGELVFNLSQMQAIQNQQLIMEGNVIWHQARLTGKVVLDLGQVDIQLNPQGQATTINLSNNNSGDVLMTGQGVIAADNYQLDLRIRAGFGKDQLRRQLMQLGELNPDGSVSIALQGNY